MERLAAALVAAFFMATPVNAQETHYRMFVLFSTPEKPKPHQLPGWKSRAADSLAQCEERKRHVTNYIQSRIPEGSKVKFKAFCVEFHAHGWGDAVDAFKRTLGDAA
jgi:hypothetical protein